jgi:indole-3-glycerol phosphate synthase
MTILQEIIINKKKELESNREVMPLKILEKRKLFKRNTLPLSTFIVDPDKSGIIAEFKRRSPSRGVINNSAILEEVTTGYFRSGASGLSILTDKKYFGGEAEDLVRARELNPIPILRKDFTIDEYQIVEARSIGADAILLIAAVLTRQQSENLARFARSLDLQVVLEIHTSAELSHVNEFVNIVGVNNRDLDTFTTDTGISVQLAGEIPPGFVKISESGINSAIIINKLKSCGYQGFLMGECFMQATEPAVAFSDFVKTLYDGND